MPNFGKLSLTNLGVNALVKAQAGNTLVFTKIKMGSGMYDGDISTLTDLVEPQLSAEIVNGTMLNNAYTVEAHFTNEELEAGFYWRELGLYVKDNNGNDILFGYANAGTSADYIPATQSEIYTKHIRVSVAVDDAQSITILNSKSTYVDIVTFTEEMDKKVDKEEGKGLSTNDYSDEEKDKLAQLVLRVEELSKSINSSFEQVNKKFDSYATNQDFEEFRIELVNAIGTEFNKLGDAVDELKNEIKIINQVAGNKNISAIGDGTVTGAIVKLYEMITSIPSITSGTTEPTGGKDGDVYIMYEK